MIKARRAELGLTLKDVADGIGLTVAALSAIETKGRLPANPAHLLGIAEALGLNATELLCHLYFNRGK